MYQRRLIMPAALVILLVAVVFALGETHAATPQLFVSNAEAGIILTRTNNGFMIANIPKFYQFNFTLNGSIFKPYVSYVNLNSAGLGLNGSFYTLDLDQPVQVRNSSNYGFYVELVSSNYYSNPQTINMSVYSVLHYSVLQVSKNTSSTTAATTTALTTTMASTIKTTTTILSGMQMEEAEIREAEPAVAAIVIIVLVVAILYYVSSMARKKQRHNKT